MGRRFGMMLQTVLILEAICIVVQGSGFVPGAAPLTAPVVTSTSSQFFERVYNRLIAAVPALENVIPVAPVPPVVQTPVAVQPVTNTVPKQVPVSTQSAPNDPNVAIAIATAHAAAPVATILLPPFPFGPPPGFEFIQPTPVFVPTESEAESTTPIITTQKATTIATQPEPTTQVPSNSDSNFVQALPSNDNQVKFKHYYAPSQPTQGTPQKLKTSVEIVPVPLTYIMPPPVQQPQIKTAKHYYKSVPARIVLRPVQVRTVRVPARIIIHSAPVRKYRPKKYTGSNYRPNLISRSTNIKEREQVSKPFSKPVIKPQRL